MDTANPLETVNVLVVAACFVGALMLVLTVRTVQAVRASKIMPEGLLRDRTTWFVTIVLTAATVAIVGTISATVTRDPVPTQKAHKTRPTVQTHFTQSIPTQPN